jgi:hypothetical protein
MITDGFGPRMVANLEIALERACKFLPDSNDGHEARRYVASKILECAKTGIGSRFDWGRSGGCNRTPCPCC